MIMNEPYQQQLNHKVQLIRTQFADELNQDIALDVFASPEKHFRQRAEFRLWHVRDDAGRNSGDAFYAMFETGKKASKETLQRTDQLPIASIRINTLMPQLLEALKAQPLLLQRLYQVEFLSTLQGETLVTLIYHKPLDDAWQAATKPLEAALGIHIIGRSRKQKIVLSQDFVTETLTVQGIDYRYRQIEGGFTQPNAVVCEKMLDWASTVAAEINTQNPNKDLLELYCGNGNFTLPLSRHFRRVLATEVAKTSVQCARHNITDNACNNIAIARLSAEEFTQAYTGAREFKRLQQDNINISDYTVSTIFVDPPRAGIDIDTLKLMKKFKNIIYISCNPDTLLDNLHTLNRSHKVVRMALFDQFPYTHHAEMGVWLQRLNSQ